MRAMRWLVRCRRFVVVAWVAAWRWPSSRICRSCRRRMSKDELKAYMKAQSKALGVECDFCHDVPDMASDKNEKKLIARKMMQMTNEINDKWMKGMKDAEKNKVTLRHLPPGPRGAAQVRAAPPAPRSRSRSSGRSAPRAWLVPSPRTLPSGPTCRFSASLSSSMARACSRDDHDFDSPMILPDLLERAILEVVELQQAPLLLRQRLERLLDGDVALLALDVAAAASAVVPVAVSPRLLLPLHRRHEDGGDAAERLGHLAHLVLEVHHRRQLAAGAPASRSVRLDRYAAARSSKRSRAYSWRGSQPMLRSPSNMAPRTR